MDKKLDMQVQVRESEMIRDEGTFTRYTIEASDYPDTDVHDLTRRLGITGDTIPIDEAGWAFVQIQHDDYGQWTSIELVPAPLMDYVGVGICGRCNEPKQLFSIERSLPELYNDMSNNAGKHRCIMCTRSTIGSQVGNDVRGFTSNQWRGMYRWLDDYTRLIVDSVRDTKIECAVCTGIMLDDGPSYLPMLVHDINGEEVKVHQTCTFSCGVCDKEVPRYSPWMYAGHRRFHDTYSVFNKQTCYECYQQFRSEYELFNCPFCNSLQDHEYSEQFMGDYACQSCYASRGECEECGTDYIGDHYCSDTNAYIHEYSYTPSLEFYPSLHTPDHDAERNLFFGFELEVECEGDYSRAQTARKALELLGNRRVYCKCDGSLDNGIEIVTHPHTLTAYQRDFNWSALRSLAEMGTRSWDNDNCGLHVHVSRKTFGISKSNPQPRNYKERTPHMVRFAKFFYDNERMITQLAGRESEDYASFSEKGNMLNKFKHGSDTRFQVVNNQPNVTLEVRIFKGSLRKERVLSAIELVHAVVEYTRELQVKPNSFAWVKFMGYLSDNVEKYPNLFTIMNELFRKGYSGENY